MNHKEQLKQARRLIAIENGKKSYKARLKRYGKKKLRELLSKAGKKKRLSTGISK